MRNFDCKRIIVTDDTEPRTKMPSNRDKISRLRLQRLRELKQPSNKCVHR